MSRPNSEGIKSLIPDAEAASMTIEEMCRSEPLNRQRTASLPWKFFSSSAGEKLILICWIAELS